MTAFLAPGQGSQAPGMGRDLYESSAPARAIFDEARAIGGDSLLDAMFSGPEDTLRDTRNAQPALVTCAVALSEHLRSEGVDPSSAAGHSVGEIAALVIAGAMPFGGALRLTIERARLKTESAPEGTMAAVLGLDPERIHAALPEGAEIANYNSPGQIIISGSVEAVESAADLMREAGAKRVLPLNVSGPFHCSLMRPAGEGLRKYLNAAADAICEPAIPFYSSVTARRETDPVRIRENLWHQISAPVLWSQTMTAMAEFCEGLELGPGSVLAGLARRIPGAIKVRPCGSWDDLQKVLRTSTGATRDQ